MLEAYMRRLKDNIKHEICLKYPKNVMESMQYAHRIQAKNRATHNSTTTYAGSIDWFVPHRATLPQPTQISQEEMDERREK